MSPKPPPLERLRGAYRAIGFAAAICAFSFVLAWPAWKLATTDRRAFTAVALGGAALAAAAAVAFRIAGRRLRRAKGRGAGKAQ